MNWSRYIKRTAVRRVVWIVVGLLVYAALSAFGIAQAQVPDGCELRSNPRSAICDYRDQAYAFTASLSVPEDQACATGATRVTHSGNGYVFEYQHGNGCGVPELRWRIDGGASYRNECPAGSWDEEFKRCNDCGSQPSRQLRINHSVLPWQASTCGDNSCQYSVSGSPTSCRTLTGPGQRAGYNCWYTATPTGSMCTPTDEPGPEEDEACPAGTMRASDGSCKAREDCPLGQFKVDGVCTPDGACPTGQVKGPDGSCNPESCPAGQARGADGTCKSDDNEDGTPDEDEEDGDGDNKDGKKFSGGESCEVPPTCSGDAIMCGQARIQWRIDCNTRKNTTVVGGGKCNHAAPPVCVGEMCDHVDQQKMLQLWESQCALQRIADAMDGDDAGQGGQPAWTRVDGMSQDPGDGEGEGEGSGGGINEIEEDGSSLVTTPIVGGGGSCPALDVSGASGELGEGFAAVLASPGAAWCQLIGYLYTIILAFGTISAVTILAKGY